jgi:DNA replication initiation complex subunit (GINS family)
MRYCPECERMLPHEYVSSNKEEISNNIKKRIGTKIAKIHDIDYKEMHAVIRELQPERDKKEFVKGFVAKIKVNFKIDILKELKEHI